MEQTVTLLSKIKQTFDCKETDIRSYSPLTLAFLGDCVYDLIIRTAIVEKANRSPKNLHKVKSGAVKAQTQAAFMDVVMELLTEEEVEVYKRGRNAKSMSVAKNASVGDYRKATGMEALLGYLFLQDREERILELVKYGLDKLEITL